MAFNLGQAFGGFAQGLAEGIPQGVQLAQRQEQIDLQKQTLKLKYIGTINDMKKWSPELRAQFGKPLLKQIGKNVGVEVSDVALEAFAKGDQALVNKMADYWATRLKGGAELKELLSEMNDPQKIAEFGAKIETGDIRRETLAETKRYHSGSLGLQSRSLSLQEEERKERRAERERAAEVSLSKSVIDDFKDTLNKEDRGKYVSALQGDQGYQMALRTGRSDIAYQRAGELLTKNPQWVNKTDVQRKVAAIKAANPSISDTDAQKIALGLQTMEVVPQTGEIRLLDKTTGTARAIPIAPGGPPAPDTPPPPTKPLYESAQEGDIAGIGSGVVDIWSRTIGQLGIKLPGQDQTIKARQDASLIGRDLVRALQNNPRFPEGERKAIAEEISIESSVWDSRAALTARMQSINTRMRERLRDAERAAKNPNMPQEMRATQIQTAEAIRNFLRKLGAPPPGLPEGAKRIGRTKSGFFVYEVKDKEGRVRQLVDEY